ncbi:Hypothetical protein A7982_01397 [Minicystis rosea]|nr:Hypothetical protein A7982_01397 [Minicystis rosea]
MLTWKGPATAAGPVALRALRTRRLLLAVPVLLFVLAATHVWVTEDAFIDFRVVQHVLAGHGPVFNVGERVEAYTNPLWVAILTLLAAPLYPILHERVPIEVTSVVLGLASTIAGVVLAQQGALQLARARGQRGLPLPLGALAIAAVPPVWSFATAGLEVGLSMGWLGLCFRGLVRYPREGRRWLPIVVGLGPLIRPDLGLYSVGFVAVLLLLRREARFRTVVAAAALPVTYQIFRMGYFAALVPSTAIAKEASLARWDQGFHYLIDFARPYHLGIPFAVAMFLLIMGARAALRRTGRRRARILAVMIVPVVCALLQAAYVTRVGGDFMHGRMLVPAWFALLMPIAVVPWTRGPTRVALVLLPWALLCMAVLRVPYIGKGKDGIGPHGIADERYYYTDRIGIFATVTLGTYGGYGWATEGYRLRDMAKQKRVLVIPKPGGRRDEMQELPLASWVPVNVVSARGHVGILGYAAGLGVHPLDRLGLGNAIAAHVTLERRGRPGHEKWMDPVWAIAHFTDVPATSKTPADTKIADARAALRCGDLGALVEATTARLTPARFVRNIMLAPRLTRFRFPGDPTAARAALCGAAR